MAEAVVVALEAVEVEEREREPLALGRAAAGVVEVDHELPTVA